MKLTSLIYICIWVAALVGWCLNIYKLAVTTLPLAEFTIVEILRILGIIVVPLGSIMGLFI